MVKHLAPEDRPREKLERVGADGLGDNELGAVVLGTGRRRRSDLEVANELLAAVGGLHGLTRVTRDGLRGIAGVGPVQASRLLAAVELGRRTLLQPAVRRLQLLAPRDAAAYLLPRHSARAVEQFGLVLLDARYRVIRTAVISTGAADMTTVHPREVFREAAAAAASALVLFHNHPSGDPAPSTEDLRLTARLVQAGEVMGIEVVDHIILADNRYYSFREAGVLAAPAGPG